MATAKNTKITTQQVKNGLFELGFKTGWAITGGEITLWENSEPQPSIDEILAAAENYVEPPLSIDEKLGIIGLSLDELKAALGL